MKQKILLQVIIMLVLLIAAILTYENAIAIASAIKSSVRFVDASAVAMAMLMILPTSMINAIKREAGNER